MNKTLNNLTGGDTEGRAVAAGHSIGGTTMVHYVAPEDECYLKTKNKQIDKHPQEECQSCGTIVQPSDKTASTSDREPGCPNCGGTDFLEAE